VFVGTFEHSLDEKGRVVLPSTFRSYLADKGFLSQYEECLGVWTEQGFREFADRLTQKVRDGAASQDSLRGLGANAHEVRPDSQGRITVPQRLREYAGLERDVVVIGAFDRIEIWDATRWQRVAPAADESLTQAVRGLGV
jgi:MraZ protein